MARTRGEVGRRRRDQVVAAAVAIIAKKGIENLSLSAIEKRTRMSRGQLTYYFPSKEDILLAVFDHTIETMRRREKAGEECPAGRGLPPQPGWGHLRAFLTFFILDPPEMPEFQALQYTFLSQLSRREDFRLRLAGLYEEWRSHLVRDTSADLGEGRVSPRTFATLIQAILHGLSIQRAADPSSYDRQEMLDVTLALLAGYLGRNGQPKPRPRQKKAPAREKPT
jgi:AcrR family transcriptional regulator